ncbi:SH3 domain-containing protein [Eubacteriales bacterium OttesenSCG-928-A19]|nr:SH3 domain-containing protein [Eubacteriales bacterium OttesenSCG-928-A19]
MKKLLLCVFALLLLTAHAAMADVLIESPDLRVETTGSGATFSMTILDAPTRVGYSREDSRLNAQENIFEIQFYDGESVFSVGASSYKYEERSPYSAGLDRMQHNLWVRRGESNIYVTACRFSQSGDTMSWTIPNVTKDNNGDPVSINYENISLINYMYRYELLDPPSKWSESGTFAAALDGSLVAVPERFDDIVENDALMAQYAAIHDASATAQDVQAALEAASMPDGLYVFPYFGGGDAAVRWLRDYDTDAEYAAALAPLAEGFLYHAHDDETANLEALFDDGLYAIAYAGQFDQENLYGYTLVCPGLDGRYISAFFNMPVSSYQRQDWATFPPPRDIAFVGGDSLSLMLATAPEGSDGLSDLVNYRLDFDASVLVPGQATTLTAAPLGGSGPALQFTLTKRLDLRDALRQVTAGREVALPEAVAPYEAPPPPSAETLADWSHRLDEYDPAIWAAQIPYVPAEYEGHAIQLCNGLNEAGEAVIFRGLAFPLSDGLRAAYIEVEGETLLGYVDVNMRVVIPFEYWMVGNFVDGLAVVIGQDESYKVIDRENNVVKELGDAQTFGEISIVRAEYVPALRHGLPAYRDGRLVMPSIYVDTDETNYTQLRIYDEEVNLITTYVPPTGYFIYAWDIQVSPEEVSILLTYTESAAISKVNQGINPVGAMTPVVIDLRAAIERIASGGAGSIGRIRVTGDANIRSGPSTDHPAVGKASSGQTFEALEQDPDTGWYGFLWDDGRVVYISSKMVELEE